MTRLQMIHALVEEALNNVLALNNDGQLLIERALNLWYSDLSYTQLENEYNATFNLV